MNNILVWFLQFFYSRKTWYRRFYLNSAHWHRIRRKKLSEDWVCENCGTKRRPLDVHHLTYKRMWFEQMSDLQVLCRSCHKKEHNP